MESNFVIKVKYSDTLRRFNVPMNENSKLDLDMDALRAKISGLFSFPPDADLTLTYVDEDGDIVTLVGDDDLIDVMRQRLKFLMINVKLSTGKGAKTYSRSSGSSTPLRSPRVMNPSQIINAKWLKSVPDPVQEALVPILNALSKIALDLGSKAAFSSKMATELIDHFSKVGLSIVNQAQQSQGGLDASIQAGGSEVPTGPSLASEPNALKDCAHQEVSPKSETKVKMLHDSGSEFPTGSSLASEPNALEDCACQEVSPKSEVKVKTLHEMGAENVRRGVGPSDVAVPTLVKSVSIPVDGNLKNPSNSNMTGCITVDPAPPSCYLPTLDGKNGAKKQESTHSGFKPFSAAVSASHILERTFASDCQFSGTPFVFSSSRPPASGPSMNPLLGKGSIQKDAMVGLFHRGVQCDGCGAHPIVGPRYKSIVKDDYDLCNICFLGMGIETDYVKIERPIPYQHPRSLRGLPETQNSCILPIPPPFPLSNLMKTKFGILPAQSKLDSRFILDVNVLDGTIMAPSTSFTKIWRMRNNGTVAWPKGTRLVWIGGDKFSNAHSVELEIPENGVAVEGELDIAVDFVSPELPGRYISHWRMASSSGSKFGQRVWVLVRVYAAIKDSFSISCRSLNLNLPPNYSGHKGPEVVDLNAEPVGHKDPEVVDLNADPVGPKGPEFVDGEDSDNSAAALEPLKPAFDEQPKNQNLNFPEADSLFVGDGISDPAAPEIPSPITFPIIDLPEAAPIGKTQSFLAADTATMSKTIGVNDVENTLLQELNFVGFKQIDLNKEILRRNEYNLEQSVDDLCGIAEWDPILEELQEMGFHDVEMNKKLLKKNNGSMKHVVMDLLTGEKA